MKSTTITADHLQTLTRDVFCAIGCSAAEADRIAKYLLGANLTGHDSHGVIRVPRYVQAKLDGIIVADQTVSALVDTPVLSALDGRRGFGQTVGPQAVRIGIDKCKAMDSLRLVCAIPATSGASVTGPKWRPKPDWCRFIL